MARVFTTAFTYNNQDHTAVISQLDGSVNIYVPDDSFHTILPNGRFSYQPEKGLPIDWPQLSLAQRLVLAILCSIEVREKHVQPVS